MLCQSNVEVLQVNEVGSAYDIAWNYLQGTGAITHPVAAHDFLLSHIVSAFAKGERNKLRLANKAIIDFPRENRSEAIN